MLDTGCLLNNERRMVILTHNFIIEILEAPQYSRQFKKILQLKSCSHLKEDDNQVHTIKTKSDLF